MKIKVDVEWLSQVEQLISDATTHLVHARTILQRYPSDLAQDIEHSRQGAYERICLAHKALSEAALPWIIERQDKGE